MRRLLTDRQNEILKQERATLQQLAVILARLGAAPEDQATLAQVMQQLDELFLLVVVGEFNSGKSAFINALLGEPLLEEGVTPTTTHIHILRYGPEPEQHPLGDHMVSFAHPVDWLREINIVDTPGTNAVIRRHQEITEEFVPRADLVLFVTSADRPFSESERAFMERIREWGKKVVVIVNKIDILDSESHVEQVLRFVEDNAQALLGMRPEIFPVSARLALRAKRNHDRLEREALWQASRFEPLEQYILQTLDEQERIRLKLTSPLGVARRVADRYLEVVQERLALLRDDLSTIDTIEVQLTAYEADMCRDFRYHLSHIDNVLHEMQARGMDFFDDMLRIIRILELLNTERVRGEFQRRVVADTVQQVEAHVDELIDWMVDQDFRQWQAVMGYLKKRATQHESHIVGQVGGQFEYSRRELLASVGRAAQEVVSSYDREREAQELAQSVQTAVAQTALIEVGAVGLGAILVKVLATALADVTGMMAAGAVAVLGLYLIPNRRRKAKNDLKRKVGELRARLAKAMTDEFERELGRSLQRIRDAIAPYTRFVRTEREKLGAIEAELVEIEQTLTALRLEIEG
ncbi:MAG TPA: GTP-binding protein [Anaerolineae bacterium]|nr:GTP-binding protein [Anaerolineae bacterium]